MVLFKSLTLRGDACASRFPASSYYFMFYVFRNLHCRITKCTIARLRCCTSWTIRRESVFGQPFERQLVFACLPVSSWTMSWVWLSEAPPPPRALCQLTLALLVDSTAIEPTRCLAARLFFHMVSITAESFSTIISKDFALLSRSLGGWSSKNQSLLSEHRLCFLWQHPLVGSV